MMKNGMEQMQTLLDYQHKKNEPKSQMRVIVSALLERKVNNETQVFVQTRFKPKSSPNYTDMLEIPAGGVEDYENIFDAIKREVFEETGLEITRFIDIEIPSPKENNNGDLSIAFRPYLCQQVLKTTGGLSWIGYVFRCEVSGEVNIDLNEAKDPRWLTIAELKKYLDDFPDKVFSLQYATLLKYVEEFS